MANVASFLPIVLHIKEANQQYFSQAIHNLKSNSLSELDREQLFSKKTKCQFVCISLVVFGIEICYAAETAFVSPLLQKIGVPVQFMSMVWGLSPLIGFFVCPILGILSDNCRWKMGRRRPFIIFYSFGIILGLLLLGYGNSLGQNLPFCLRNDPNICVVILVVIGVVLLDFNCDACQSPARAYLIDVSVVDDHSIGLSTFTVMAGAGGAVGYVLGGIPWDDLVNSHEQSNTSVNTLNSFNSSSTIVSSALTMVLVEGEAPSVNNHLRILFTSVAIIYILSTLICISSFKEIPLESQCGEYEVFDDNERTKNKFSNVTALENLSTRRSKSLSSFASNFSASTTQPQINHQDSQGFHSLNFSKSDRASNIGTLVKSHFLSIVGLPPHLKWLCLTHCFSWMSLLCFSLYFTDFVGEEIYGGDPNEKPNVQKHATYIKGVRMGSLCMALYSLSCSFYSFFMRHLINRFTTKYVYAFSQLTYALGMLLFAFSRSILMAPLTALTAGMIYSTLFTIPFILVASYHSKDDDLQMLIENSNFEDDEEKEHQEKKNMEKKRGLGADLALINSMVFCAQIILSFFIGTLMKFVGSKVVVVYGASLFATCGALSSTKLLYFD